VHAIRDILKYLTCFGDNNSYFKNTQVDKSGYLLLNLFFLPTGLVDLNLDVLQEN
jgi:hypothetical protein